MNHASLSPCMHEWYHSWMNHQSDIMSSNDMNLSLYLHGRHAVMCSQDSAPSWTKSKSQSRHPGSQAKSLNWRTICSLRFEMDHVPCIPKTRFFFLSIVKNKVGTCMASKTARPNYLTNMAHKFKLIGKRGTPLQTPIQDSW